MSIFAVVTTLGLLASGPAAAQSCADIFTLDSAPVAGREALVRPEIRALNDRDNVITCGTCLSRVGGFFNSFMEPLKEYFETGFVQPNTVYRTGAVGKFVLVFSRGELLGVIKSTGDDSVAVDGSRPKGYLNGTSNPTFMALRDARDGNGDPVLKLGHLYYMSKDVWPQYMAVVNSQGPFVLNADQKPSTMHEGVETHWGFKRNFSTGILDVDKIGLMPINDSNLLVSVQYKDIAGIEKMLAKIHDAGLDINAKDFKTQYANAIRKPENVETFNANLFALLTELRQKVEEERARDPELKALRAALRRASVLSYNEYFNLEF